jgi:hypothetical protein
MTAYSKIGFALLILAGVGSAVAAQSPDGLRQQSQAEAPVTNTILRHSESILGKDLVASGENAGRIVDVLADETGQIRAVVVEFGGFLGVGTRKVAIAWSDLRFSPNGGSNVVAAGLSRDRLSEAPEVKAGRPVIVISAHDSLTRGVGLQN